jgi:uncharacterized protein YdiU (UPF0061 family)
MNAPHASGFVFDNTFARDLEGLYQPWKAAIVPQPTLLAINNDLAGELGLDTTWLSSSDGVDVLSGNRAPDGAACIAQAYAGHQFGNYSPRLGDGRAMLVGEIIDAHGQRRDLHLKGSGRTPFARGGDGKAAVGPMLREYIIGEAMHALRIPTTRALAVVATGEQIARDTLLPGAVLARVAASHLRVGMFQYAAAHDDPTLLRRLANHAIARHYPLALQHVDNPEHNQYLAFYEAVVEAQAQLIAKWMSVGFIHGVMNTDNMTISGETIDYGPCAFMDAFDPATVFSSIDHSGRYAYGSQPVVAQWNLARLAETLLPLIHSDRDVSIAKATESLQSFTQRYSRQWSREIHAKLGFVDTTSALATEVDPDTELINDLFAIMQSQRVDFTSFFRALSRAVVGDNAPVHALLTDTAVFDEWADRWTAQIASRGVDVHLVAAAMNATNPVYIPRNHKVEEALAAAVAGDMQPFVALVDVLSQPFTERPGLEAFAVSAPDSFAGYRTFCGT